MHSITNQQVKGKHGKPILTDFFYKKDQTKKPIVIFCHGYKGYKDWGSWNIMAHHFANRNYFFVKFNFSHNGGTIEQPIDFPDLEAFGNNNFTKELDDLRSVIDFVVNNPDSKEEIDEKDITLIGHSRGGGIATLKAHEDNRITKVISWAAISDIEARFPKGERLQLWKENKIAYVENSRTKQQMPVKYQLYENFMDNKERLHIKTAVTHFTIPHLIVHGTNDTVVLPQEAENLHSWNPKSELFLVKDMDHALGNKQPWLEKEMPEDMIKVVERTIDFMERN